MGIQEVRCDGVDWIQLALNRVYWQVVVNTVVNLS
jgi:hypothetical protein